MPPMSPDIAVGQNVAPGLVPKLRQLAKTNAINTNPLHPGHARGMNRTTSFTKTLE